jgi:hypothetical protein
MQSNGNSWAGAERRACVYQLVYLNMNDGRALCVRRRRLARCTYPGCVLLGS